MAFALKYDFYFKEDIRRYLQHYDSYSLQKELALTAISRLPLALDDKSDFKGIAFKVKTIYFQVAGLNHNNKSD